MKPEKEKTIMRKRDLRLDIIRCIAAFSVISVHFLSHIQYYEASMEGGRMFLMTLMRTAFMVCVPLFLMLTGYLMHQKQLKKGYYKGILKTLGIYILAALAYQVSLSLFSGAPVSLRKYLLQILGFGGYGWYIEMYIGLFLLIPFLNAMWRGLKGQKQKMLLIVTLLALTTLPSLFNIYDWHTPGFWQLPSSASSFQRIVPAWWLLLYPLTYYFIGAYLQEYGLKLRAWQTALALAACIAAFGAFQFYRSTPDPFQNTLATDWGGFPILIESVLLFHLLLQIKTTRIPRFFRLLFTKISELSLGIYLVSIIFDNIFYPRLTAAVSSVPLRLNYYPVIVPLVFICSALASQLLLWIQKAIAWPFRRIPWKKVTAHLQIKGESDL